MSRRRRRLLFTIWSNFIEVEERTKIPRHPIKVIWGTNETIYLADHIFPTIEIEEINHRTAWSPQETASLSPHFPHVWRPRSRTSLTSRIATQPTFCPSSLSSRRASLRYSSCPSKLGASGPSLSSFFYWWSSLSVAVARLLKDGLVAGRISSSFPPWEKGIFLSLSTSIEEICHPTEADFWNSNSEVGEIEPRPWAVSVHSFLLR